MVITHVYFNGQCRQAIGVYTKAFGAEVITVIESAEEDSDLIIHAEIMIHGNKLMLNDFGDNDGHSPSGGYQLCVDFRDKDELLRVYSELREGSITILSPASTDYSECVVRFIDKFGVRWALMVNHI